VFPVDHNRRGPDFGSQPLNHARPLSDVADISATRRTRYTNLGIEIDEEDGCSEHTPAEHLQEYV
jgi:hypothetical protein